MSIDTRAIASWGMFPNIVPTTIAPFGACWGLVGALPRPVALHHIKAVIFSIAAKSAQISLKFKTMQFASYIQTKSMEFTIS
jgi:hypothetical protein